MKRKNKNHSQNETLLISQPDSIVSITLQLLSSAGGHRSHWQLARHNSRIGNHRWMVRIFEVSRCY